MTMKHAASGKTRRKIHTVFRYLSTAGMCALTERRRVPNIDDSGVTVYVRADPLDGGYVVTADSRARGVVSQGETVAEALENFADAYVGCALAAGDGR